MTTTPIVDAARFGRSIARLRRFQNVATLEDGSGAVPDQTDFRDLSLASLSVTIDPSTGGTGAPIQVGQTWLGGINKTTGGTMVLNIPSGVQFSGAWVTTLTFTGAGAWAYLIGIKYNDNYRWAVLASNGVS